MARRIDVATLGREVRAGTRWAIAQAITLVESRHPDDVSAARTLISDLGSTLSNAPHGDSNSRTESAIRVGITGVPGVGKSTFIDSLGIELISRGLSVGVLAVDPSSVRTGGSVLGDKTRMTRLAANPKSFIRPSPTAGTLGGVTRATAQAMVVLEAAGFDVILVETVGVGQSEVTVAGMVDTFVFLTVARLGDQLQGMKKGILELADVIAVNKADNNEVETHAAARELAGVLRLVHRGQRQESANWLPPVLTCSAATAAGVDAVWDQVLRHRARLGPAGLAAKRAEQQLAFAWQLVQTEIETRLRATQELAQVREEIRAGRMQATTAADQLFDAFTADVLAQRQSAPQQEIEAPGDLLGSSPAVERN